ncbi:hypothetical protein HMPREF1142_2078 [Peptostreptococcaceae bacterium AS15]|nr:hypothetical protein HMPREF1142_2078 [Peptostreptococcaceae bacterium AS15]
MKSKAVFTILGGGTGQSNILRGLKKFDVVLNSIVTMADDGGSSGILRNEMNILPPGDLRNCILALSDTEPEMEKLFQYRFQKGSLKGQNFGNLFLAAMQDIHGDFKKAISYTSKILAVRGNVYPVTYDNINLLAKLENGNIVYGESNISNEVIEQKSKIDRVYFEPEHVSASEDAIKAIRNSDMIIAGPGSLYTSIFPVILIEGIKKELEQSKAVKIFITNIMTENGETDNFSSLDFHKELSKNGCANLFDYYVLNIGEIPKDIYDRYRKKGQDIVKNNDCDKSYFLEKNIKTINENLVFIKDGFIFHDNIRVSKLISEIYEWTYDKKLSFI